MLARRLREHLDEAHVRYTTIGHSIAYTAQEIAESAHIPGHELAKVVIVDLDGELVMAVVRGTDKVDLDLLRAAAGASRARLASEREFESRFPGVDPSNTGDGSGNDVRSSAYRFNASLYESRA